MQYVHVLYGLLIVFFLTGCASPSYRHTESGEKIVWIDQIQRDAYRKPKQSSVGALAAQIAGVAGFGVGGQVLANMGGRAVGDALSDPPPPGQINVGYFPSQPSRTKITVGDRTGWRDAWEGSDDLHSWTWAILRRDEKGEILVPCEECAPHVEAQTDAAQL